MSDTKSADPADSPTHQDLGTALPPPPSPTRILLRLPVKEWVWESYSDAIVAYLEWANRSVSDFRQGKHEVFVELQQDPEVPQKRYHIALDLYTLSYNVKDMKDVRNMEDVKHEMYDVRRDSEGKITLRLPHPERHVAHIIRRTREITDEKWPWEGEHVMLKAYTK
ncbi:hypothetical protein QM012_002169 [Aureobasidium pullulans]|uniref:Uncharacterized protein n=1 Tax=Aureobasidium pullulans TaxID=5580 RepID=A0ABR0TB93_AURPU